MTVNDTISEVRSVYLLIIKYAYRYIYLRHYTSVLFTWLCINIGLLFIEHIKNNI